MNRINFTCYFGLINFYGTLGNENSITVTVDIIIKLTACETCVVKMEFCDCCS